MKEREEVRDGYQALRKRNMKNICEEKIGREGEIVDEILRKKGVRKKV